MLDSSITEWPRGFDVSFLISPIQQLSSKEHVHTRGRNGHLINMESTDDEDANFINSILVTGSTATSIEVSWEVHKENVQNIQGYRVHFQKLGSRYVQTSPMLVPTVNEYSVGSLIMDTYYKVCLIMYRNDTAPMTECIDASTANWHIPVSIGSSIGAVLALSIIVFLVFVSRCPSLTRRKKKKVVESGKYDSMSSHMHDDNYELSDTTTHAPDDDMFSDQDSSNIEYTQPLHLPVRPHHHHHHHHGDRPTNGNRNFIKPNIPAHVLHKHSPRSGGKPHSDAYLSRHGVGSPLSPSRNYPGNTKAGSENNRNSTPLSRQLISQRQHSLDTYSNASTPVQTPGSPSSITDNHIAPKLADTPTSKGDKSTTIPRCSKASHQKEAEEGQACMSLPRHMAALKTAPEGQAPKQTVAKLEHNLCSRQHTV